MPSDACSGLEIECVWLASEGTGRRSTRVPACRFFCSPRFCAILLQVLAVKL